MSAIKNYLCPVCRAPRKAHLSDHLSKRVHFQMFVLVGFTATAAFVISGVPMAFRTAIFYLPLWGALEFVHGVRAREAARCPTCDFDPVLYRRDWRAARSKVEKRLGSALELQMKEIENRKKKTLPVSATTDLDRVPAAATDSKVAAVPPKPSENQRSLFS